MARVYNHSKERYEEAEYKKCPRCKGVGGNIRDTMLCDICNGDGKTFITPTGWTRAKYSRNSKLY